MNAASCAGSRGTENFSSSRAGIDGPSASPSYEERSRQRRDQIVELHRQGLKGYEIARELNVSSGLVSIRLKEARSAGVDLTRYDAAGDAHEQGKRVAS